MAGEKTKRTPSGEGVKQKLLFAIERVSWEERIICKFMSKSLNELDVEGLNLALVSSSKAAFFVKNHSFACVHVGG